MRNITILMLVVLATLSLLSNSAQSQTVDSSQIDNCVDYTGELIMKRSKYRIVGAAIVFYDVDADIDSIELTPQTPHVFSDKDGRFSIRLPEKSYKIKITCVGFKPKILTINTLRKRGYIGRVVVEPNILCSDD